MARTFVWLAVTSLLLLGLAGCGPRVSAPPDGPTTDVLVVVCENLGWTAVTSTEMPVARSLAEDGAVGLVVSRTPARTRALLEVVAAGGGTGEIGIARADGSPSEIDRLVAEAVGRVSEDTAVVVVAVPTASHAGFVVVRGGGYGRGLLTSSSTRRAGIVTDEDVRAAVIRIAGGMPAGGGESSAPSVLVDDETAVDRVARLVELETYLAAMDRLRYPLLSGYTALMVLLVVGGWRVAEAAGRLRRSGYVSLVLQRALLFMLAVPGGSIAMSVWNRTPESPERIVVQLLGATAVIWLMAEVAWNRWGITGGVAFVGLSTSLLVGADQLLGAPFSVSALISYSPLMALRFYGLGNEGAAVLVGSTLIGMTFLLEIVHADTVRVRVATIAAGVAVVSLAALPFFGANIIVGVWGTVTFAAFLVSSQRRRATWRDLVLAGATSAAVVALTALLDRFTGSGTHVARAIDDVAGGGLPALVITRLTTALAIFTSSPLPAVVLVIMLGFLYACLRPHGRMAAAFAAYPLLRAAFVATLAGGVLGTVVEDSGLVILGLCIMYLAAPLVLVMLQSERDSRGAVS